MPLFIDPPEIEVERPFVHTGVGHEAQLICVVHAEPQAHVIWYKETTQLGTTEQLSQQVHAILSIDSPHWMVKFSLYTMYLFFLLCAKISIIQHLPIVILSNVWRCERYVKFEILSRSPWNAIFVQHNFECMQMIKFDC